MWVVSDHQILLPHMYKLAASAAFSMRPFRLSTKYYVRIREKEAIPNIPTYARFCKPSPSTDSWPIPKILFTAHIKPTHTQRHKHNIHFLFLLRDLCHCMFHFFATQIPIFIFIMFIYALAPLCVAPPVVVTRPLLYIRRSWIQKERWW